MRRSIWARAARARAVRGHGGGLRHHEFSTAGYARFCGRSRMRTPAPRPRQPGSRQARRPPALREVTRTHSTREFQSLAIERESFNAGGARKAQSRRYGADSDRMYRAASDPRHPGRLAGRGGLAAMRGTPVGPDSIFARPPGRSRACERGTGGECRARSPLPEWRAVMEIRGHDPGRCAQCVRPTGPHSGHRAWGAATDLGQQTGSTGQCRGIMVRRDCIAPDCSAEGKVPATTVRAGEVGLEALGGARFRSRGPWSIRQNSRRWAVTTTGTLLPVSSWFSLTGVVLRPRIVAGRWIKARGWGAMGESRGSISDGRGFKADLPPSRLLPGGS